MERQVIRQYEGKVQLQSIGLKDGIKAKNLQVGDVMLWNGGATSTVKEITFSKTGKTLYVKTEYIGYNGEVKEGERTFRADRLVAIKEFAKVEEEITEVQEDAIEDVIQDQEDAIKDATDQEVNQEIQEVEREREKALKKWDRLKVSRFVDIDAVNEYESYFDAVWWKTLHEYDMFTEDQDCNELCPRSAKSTRKWLEETQRLTIEFKETRIY